MTLGNTVGMYAVNTQGARFFQYKMPCCTADSNSRPMWEADVYMHVSHGCFEYLDANLAFY